MNIILAWYLVTAGSNRSVSYSPPMPTVEECIRLQRTKTISDWAQTSQCVQLQVVVLK